MPNSSTALEDDPVVRIFRLDMLHIAAALPWLFDSYKLALENAFRRVVYVYSLTSQSKHNYPQLDVVFDELRDGLLGITGAFALNIVGFKMSLQKMSRPQKVLAYLRVGLLGLSGRLAACVKAFDQDVNNLELVARCIVRVHVFNKLIQEMHNDPNLNQQAIAAVAIRFEALKCDKFMRHPLKNFYKKNFSQRINKLAHSLQTILQELKFLARMPVSHAIVDPAAALEPRSPGRRLAWDAVLNNASDELASTASPRLKAS